MLPRGSPRRQNTKSVDGEKRLTTSRCPSASSTRSRAAPDLSAFRDCSTRPTPSTSSATRCTCRSQKSSSPLFDGPVNTRWRDFADPAITSAAADAIRRPDELTWVQQTPD